MAIRYVNISIVRRTLFIGLKNKLVIEETEIHPRSNLHGTAISSALPEEREAKLLDHCVNVSLVWLVFSLSFV